jgi:3-hydroxyisobutyrate dehydrogenase-like beta-hydroxyacid dehydrogenase
MRMPIVGLLSAGQMGAALGAALRGGGAQVLTTLEGRSERTANLAKQAGLTVLPTFREVVEESEIVLSVTPPGAAAENAGRIAAAAPADKVVADLNAVSPATMAEMVAGLPGLRLVDGSISGPPPAARRRTTIYLSGADAGVVAGLPWGEYVETVVVSDRVGAASAVKMCTGSVYKGLTALITQAMRTAGANGVLDHVVADLERNGLAQTGSVVRSAPKAHRFVAEMREVAATQQAAGLNPALFEAIAEIYAEIADTRLAQGFPESAPELSPSEIVARLAG